MALEALVKLDTVFFFLWVIHGGAGGYANISETEPMMVRVASMEQCRALEEVWHSIHTWRGSILEDGVIRPYSVRDRARSRKEKDDDKNRSEARKNIDEAGDLILTHCQDVGTAR